MRLTTHFDLAEFTASQTASRLGIDNEPPQELYGHLMRTAEMMEKVRELLGSPIIITSGYRCMKLNTAVGSSGSSAHILGLAVDFISPSFGSPYHVCKILESRVPAWDIDQLIFEFGSWTHIGLRIREPRHQLLTIDRNGTRGGIG